MKNKEFHWFESTKDMPELSPNNFLGYFETATAIAMNWEKINSDQAYFFSAETLENGYKLFAHFTNGNTTEVKFGDQNTSTNREIRPSHNISKLLMAEEFGKLSI